MSANSNLKSGHLQTRASSILLTSASQHQHSPVIQVVLPLALLLLLQTSLVQAQDSTALSLFAGVGIAQNFSTASISAYDGSTACGVFQSGNGVHPDFYLGLRWAPAGVPMPLRFSASYDDLSTRFTTSPDVNRNTPLAYRLTDHTYVPVDRERSYDASLGLLALHSATSFDVFSLNVTPGIFGGLLVRHSYLESERIVTSGVVYNENQLSHRPIGSGDVGVNAFQAGLELGLSYPIHFQRDLWLEPRLEYRYPFTSISSVSSSAWRITPVSASIGLAYRFPEPEAPIPFTVATWDSLIDQLPASVSAPPAPKLDASLTVLDTAGKPIVDPELAIERTHVIEVFPMLHYIFFEDGSAEIPFRYDMDGEFVSEARLAGLDALDIHHRILDIVGRRLANAPKATITLTGTRSEHARNDSLAGAGIAHDRAETIAKYLERRWKIDRARVKIIGRSLPDAASDDHTRTGQAENRRVEISSNDPSITDPVRVERIERTATPPSFNFKPDIVSSEGVRSATITVRQGRRVLLVANALTGGIRDEYLWTLDDRSMPDTRDSLIYELRVEDSTGHIAVATGSIHLRSTARDRYVHRSDTSLDRDVHRYSLILFDYSSSQPDKKKAATLMAEMAKAVLDSSRIRLTGHTDQTGDDEFNDALARQRVEQAAQMLAKRLAERGQAGHPIEIESRGSQDQLFDNSVPEGRLLSRTVRAYIEEELP